MAQLSVANSIPKKLEALFGTSTSAGVPTLPIKGIFKSVATTSNPADFTAVANTSALTTATATVTGVAVGDAVLAWGVVSGLATNQYVVAVYVSATDTITAIVGNALNTTVTTTAVVLNVIIADLT